MIRTQDPEPWPGCRILQQVLPGKEDLPEVHTCACGAVWTLEGWHAGKALPVSVLLPEGCQPC